MSAPSCLLDFGLDWTAQTANKGRPGIGQENINGLANQKRAIMLVKFETKSSRVKGLAFHPKRPWVLTSLHNGVVQLWDYRMGTLVDKYEEHEGPIRGCAFHPTQPLFVTGGDDGKIKVFNYQQRRCIFTLTGHLDYIRTVFFHAESPWIVSASDDQTVRVWNWQSRSCLAVLTGHSHYVMCAQFHPKEDLLVSASLDQTIRIWDIGSLKRKHSSPASSPYEDFRLQSPRNQQVELFGAPEGQVKFVLEGHDRGVNWVQFHPTKPMVVSGSDDRSVKLWRYNDARAWETDTFRGHFNNVSCVMFHPHADLIISDSEDKTVRVWDYNKRGSLPTIHRRDGDRFWTLAAHPELNLLAAGHDNGMLVFKLEHERPAYCVFDDVLLLAREKTIVSIDLASGTETMIASLDARVRSPAFLAHSVSEKSVLLSSAADASEYQLVSIRAGSSASGDATSRKGRGSFASFIARNRFVVFDQADKQIHIKAMDNTTFRSLPSPANADRLLPSTTGTVLLASGETVFLYDLQQDKIVAEGSISGVKYACWSLDASHLALFGKQSLYIVDRRTLVLIASVRDNVNIKSAVWDQRGILFYTNSHHLKYVLPNGDVGIICTMQAPLYLARVRDEVVVAVDRTANVHIFTIDPTEFLFKLALQQGDRSKVMHMVQNANLMGQSIIAYLRQNGYAEIALGFVQDPATRFDLAIECCDLEQAFEAAKRLDRLEIWSRLGEESLALGSFAMAEDCLRRTGNLARLSFLYLITGNFSKLQSATDEARAKGDFNSRLQNDILLGDNLDLANALVDLKIPALAYCACKSAELEIEGQDILENNCPDKSAVASLQIGGFPRMDPFARQTEPWPLLSDPVRTKISLSPAGTPQRAVEAVSPGEQSNYGGTAFHPPAPEELENAGWDLEDRALKFDSSSPADETEDFVDVEDGELPQPGASLVRILVADSQIAFNHAAAGDFASAMQLLYRQAGIVNFAVLEPLLIKCFQGSNVSFREFDRDTEFFMLQSKSATEQPMRPRPIFTLKALREQFEGAMQLTTNGRFSEAIKILEDVLHAILLTVVEGREEEAELKSMIGWCREYILGLGIERARKEAMACDEARSLFLACSFTKCKLRPEHTILALRSALTQAFKLQCTALAGRLARRLLAQDPGEAIASQARKVVGVAEKLALNHVDLIAIEIDLADEMEIGIDARSLAPLSRDSERVSCSFCGAVAGRSDEDDCGVCTVCSVGQFGGEASGLVCVE